jgi:hypothetical protein
MRALPVSGHEHASSLSFYDRILGYIVARMQGTDPTLVGPLLWTKWTPSLAVHAVFVCAPVRLLGSLVFLPTAVHTNAHSHSRSSCMHIMTLPTRSYAHTLHRWTQSHALALVHRPAAAIYHRNHCRRKQQLLVLACGMSLLPCPNISGKPCVPNFEHACLSFTAENDSQPFYVKENLCTVSPPSLHDAFDNCPTFFCFNYFHACSRT